MLNKFNVPEKIYGEKVTAVKKNHDFDNEMFNAINNNREYLRKYLFWVDKTNTMQDAVETTDMFLNKWEEGDEFAYVIIDEDKKLVGSIGAQNINYNNHNVEFGYWLSENETGKGYMSDILKKLEDVFIANGFIRLVIMCDVENTASNNVAKRNGYKLEGTLRKALNSYGEFHDCNVYAKIK